VEEPEPEGNLKYQSAKNIADPLHPGGFGKRAIYHVKMEDKRVWGDGAQNQNQDDQWNDMGDRRDEETPYHVCTLHFYIQVQKVLGLVGAEVTRPILGSQTCTRNAFRELWS